MMKFFIQHEIWPLNAKQVVRHKVRTFTGLTSMLDKKRHSRMTNPFIFTIMSIFFITACAYGGADTMTSETYILSRSGAPSLALNYYPAKVGCTSQFEPVLFIHGATFPSELSVGYTIGNQSWAGDLNVACFDVWALNFAGYGLSGDYTALNRQGDPAEVPGRSHEVKHQIARAVELIRERTPHRKVSILAHSWGTIPAGAFAADNPALVKNLILFGAIAQREGAKADVNLPPTQLVSVKEQHDKFVHDTPPSHVPVLDEAIFATWASHYLAGDPHSASRSPSSVEVPSGPIADIMAAWTGSFPYDPSRIKAPTLIIRGEWDHLSTEEDNAWLKQKLSSAASVVDVALPEGGHLMHFENGRFRLRDEVRSFLIGKSQSGASE